MLQSRACAHTSGMLGLRRGPREPAVVLDYLNEMTCWIPVGRFEYGDSSSGMGL